MPSVPICGGHFDRITPFLSRTLAEPGSCVGALSAGEGPKSVVPATIWSIPSQETASHAPSNAFWPLEAGRVRADRRREVSMKPVTFALVLASLGVIEYLLRKRRKKPAGKTVRFKWIGRDRQMPLRARRASWVLFRHHAGAHAGHRQDRLDQTELGLQARQTVEALGHADQVEHGQAREDAPRSESMTR